MFRLYLCFTGEMDDVLDCVCIVQCNRNIHRCTLIMVSVFFVSDICLLIYTSGISAREKLNTGTAVTHLDIYFLIFNTADLFDISFYHYDISDVLQSIDP